MSPSLHPSLSLLPCPHQQAWVTADILMALPWAQAGSKLVSCSEDSAGREGLVW